MTQYFTTLDEFRAILADLPAACQKSFEAAQERNSQLTKPAGALGRLEHLALWYASWVGDPRPVMKAPQAIIFAGNHGVAEEGVSAFPPEVTAQMVLNFEAGGAAINQLCNAFGAKLDVISLDLDRPTGNFTKEPAMSKADLLKALQIGWQSVDASSDLLITGEMGIGNTTAAAAIAAALYGGGGTVWGGRGTGLDDTGVALKARVIDAGLALHKQGLGDPLAVLQCLGGREIAAMAGAMARARIERIPVLLDGFIASSAAAVLHALNPNALEHAQAAHVSAEGAHSAMLERMGKTPLLSLGLRLGEGSGAALAIGLLKAALACHCGMSTFAEAGVSDSDT